MSDISKCAERYQDPAVEKRLMGLDEKTTAVHPREFVERDGLYIHHRRDDAKVTVTVMSVEELAALRTSFDGFDEVLLSIAGVLQASVIDRLEAALSVPGPVLMRWRRCCGTMPWQHLRICTERCWRRRMTRLILRCVRHAGV